MNQSDAYLDALKFDDQGLLPVIAQDAVTKDVLMVAWMNRNAVAETLRTGEAHYFSRSRQTLWRKGEQSGHVQHVKEIRLDCDGDVLLLFVDQVGGIACQTGRSSCFFRVLRDQTWQEDLDVIKDPSEIYKDD